MQNKNKTQLNVRVSEETSKKLDAIVEFYQENTKIGRLYKGDVLTDIIEKSYELMNKQRKINRRF
jgi:hypothetical protein